MALCVLFAICFSLCAVCLKSYTSYIQWRMNQKQEKLFLTNLEYYVFFSFDTFAKVPYGPFGETPRNNELAKKPTPLQQPCDQGEGNVHWSFTDWNVFWGQNLMWFILSRTQSKEGGGGVRRRIQYPTCLDNSLSKEVASTSSRFSVVVSAIGSRLGCTLSFSLCFTVFWIKLKKTFFNSVQGVWGKAIFISQNDFLFITFNISNV